MRPAGQHRPTPAHRCALPRPCRTAGAAPPLLRKATVVTFPQQMSRRLAAHPDDPRLLRQLDRDHLWHPWSPQRRVDERLMVVSGQGCYVQDLCGRRYLDLRAGTLNAAVGYSHPKIIEAITAQASALMTWDLGEATTVPATRLAARLAELAPGALSRTLFCNSGSEAVEAALKIARGFHALSGRTERTWVLSLHDGYHGTTTAGIAATGSPFRRTGAGPLPTGYAHVPTPRCSSHPGCGDGTTHRRCEAPGADELEALIQRIGPEKVAAFVLEPVLGIGGVIVPPAGYLREIREICDRHQVLLIADEVATGLGRTGRWFGCDHEDVVPDILVTAKHLTAGYAPLSAVTTTQDIYQAFASDPYLGGLRHGHTTGGHATACAAALAVLEVLADEHLVPRAAMLGDVLLEQLRPALEIPGIRAVRGRGLLVGLETDSLERAAAIAAKAQTEGVLVRAFGPVLTLAPPLVISLEETLYGASVLLDACAKTAPAQVAR